MKKLLLVAALMLSTQAFADGYEQTQIKMAYCKNVAEDAQDAYVDRTQEMPRATVFDIYAPMFALEKEHWHNSEFVGVTYAYDKAISQKDAYMRTWAHCMDDVSDD